MSDPVANPPFYVFFAHSSLSNPLTAALSSTLGHPVIHYHYADDSPLSLLPNHSDEHVLILSYDGNSSKPTVQSISEKLSVVGLRLEEAPGAAAEDETGTRNNTIMYLYCLMLRHSNGDSSPMSASHGDRKSVHDVLAQYKHRNTVLRKAFQYPANEAQETSTSQEALSLASALS
ncbi:hypothetical protein CVT25_012353 [Psilocybe cyanescens]|uniref:Uncharacterized protein n=1 Tax=Psilocybe cyanescens TaxID=93625 RepID=A0A409XFN7_PSICY|nr:hypothetical protein CVT25_012353 [Psilocybe cyanescens]